MHKRQLLRHLLLASSASVLLLTGCATLTDLAVSVRSFGDWPAGRAPGSYAFDRLPSQQAAGAQQQALEDAAAAALAGAGFKPVAAGAQPDVLVQVGARVNRAEASPWDDPLWWRGGWRHTPWRGAGWGLGLGWGSGWSMRYDNPRFEREVALLLRDRASGKPLYEAHASSEGYNSTLDSLLAPMLSAAMRDFPATRSEPHPVRVQQ